MYNISKGTIVRTIMLVILIINLILKACGKPLIDVEEGTLFYWLEVILEIAVIITTFWKNNSFSKAAIKADEFLKKLKNGETDNPQFDTQIEPDETITIDTEVTEDVESI